MKIVKVLGSVACFLALNMNQAEAMQTYIKPLSIEKSYENLKFAELCGVVSSNNIMTFLVLNELQSIENNAKKAVLALRDTLAQVIEIAQDRVKQESLLKPYNEKVLFTSLALYEIINNLLANIHFKVEVSDIVAFGRGIFEARGRFE